MVLPSSFIKHSKLEYPQTEFMDVSIDIGKSQISKVHFLGMFDETEGYTTPIDLHQSWHYTIIKPDCT